MLGILLDPLYMEHDTGAHPERPERLQAVQEAVDGLGSLPLERLEPVRADTRDLALLHDPAYIDWVRLQVEAGVPRLDHDTSVCRRSYDVSLHAVGGALAGVDAIVAGRLKQAFFCVRPPGHHAEVRQAMGFCLFNNIGIAAKHLVVRHGLHRVAVWDYDVHHGNGTMHAFYEDDTVFYGSVHQWPWYPGTGRRDETGSGRGLGFTLNVPCPSGSGDDDYEDATGRFCDAMEKFKPEFLLASVGFDGHWSDPLAGHRVTEAGYDRVARMLSQAAAAHCGGRLALFLEGGYNLTAVRNCTAATVTALVREMGDSP